MSHLFLLTIGPVQSFIKQARKTRDLYAGSQMLSLLVAKGMEACKQAAERQEATLTHIFPHFEPDKKAVSLPNRFIVKIDFTTEPTAKQLRDLAGSSEGGVEYAVRKCFNEMAEKALQNAQKTPPKGFWLQIEQHLDIHWAFQPIGTDGYKSAYLALERLLGSVKNVRPFGQYQYQDGVPFGERGRKCSLDGENNALFYRLSENGETPAMLKHNKLGNDSNLTEIFAAVEWGDGEALGAVGMLKRMYGRGKDTFDEYPSTSAVALMDSMNRCKNDVPNFQDAFSRGNFGRLIQGEEEIHISLKEGDWADWNDQFLYEENLIPKYIPNATQLGIAKERHRKLKEAGFTFDKYYALLAFDGDSMGKWLSGAKLPEGRDLEAFHKKLSQRLSVFAEKAKAIVDDTKRGKTIYAGGDDYLGFINLQYLFETVKELREEFHKIVNGGEADMKLTFSAGIVVAHYKEPLGMVVQKARDMEKAAKEQGDRNAFGLAVLKASGEVQQTVYEWDKDKDSLDGCTNWEALQGVFEGLKGEVYSNKFVVNLTTELHQLAGIELDEVDEQTPNAKAVTDGVKLEVKRLIGKAKNPSKSISDEQEQEMIGKVCALNDNAPPPKTQNFVHALQIADFLHRKITNN